MYKSRYLFWIWLIILIIINIIPTGGSLDYISKSSSDQVQLIRTDYLIHFLGFFLLPIFFLLGEVYEKQKYSRKYSLIAFMVAICTALGAELIQLLITYRTYNPKDLLFNLLGLLTGYILTAVVAKRFFKNTVNLTGKKGEC